MKTITIIDSHTGGEPTRLVTEGGPELGAGPLGQRLARFQSDFDHLRAAIVCEPRGSDVLVGALLCAPHAPDCVAGIIFFNNVGFLGMCGHGMMGAIASLAFLGRIGVGLHRVDTPVGVVQAELHADGSVTVANVASYRSARAVTVQVDGRAVTGDVAWGGNWFFLVSGHGLALEVGNIEALTRFAAATCAALEHEGVRGDDGALIDHVELFAPARSAGIDSQNFVLCPGKAYDRSPCGTGTSAKLACLAADGLLAEGAPWRQQSIIGSVFDASYRMAEGRVMPSIRGRAWVTAQAQLIIDPSDPFAWGIMGD
ncbi:MAG: proline racemase family protein [Pseudomonadota bacterium]